MANDLTPSEARFVRALCLGSGPLGLPPAGLARAMKVSSVTIINLATIVERKGYCLRERYGMRIFLRPTPAARDFVVSAPEDAYTSGLAPPSPRTRVPRHARPR